MNTSWFFHSQDDNVIGVEETDRIVAALKQSGKRLNLVEYNTSRCIRRLIFFMLGTFTLQLLLLPAVLLDFVVVLITRNVDMLWNRDVPSWFFLYHLSSAQPLPFSSAMHSSHCLRCTAATIAVLLLLLKGACDHSTSSHHTISLPT